MNVIVAFAWESSSSVHDVNAQIFAITLSVVTNNFFIVPVFIIVFLSFPKILPHYISVCSVFALSLILPDPYSGQPE